METMEKKLTKVLIGIGRENREFHFHKDYDCEILRKEAGGNLFETKIDLQENDPFFCKKCFSELFNK